MIFRVLILIVDYNTTCETSSLSLSLARCTSTLNYSTIKLTIVHIDNGNPYSVQLTPEQRRAGIHLIQTGQNLGYAGALHFAIRQMEKAQKEKQEEPYDAYWLLNSDLEIEEDTLSQLIKTLTSKPHIGAIGPLIYSDQQRTKVWGSRGCIYPLLGLTAMKTSKNFLGPLPKWSYIPGCSLLVKKAAFQAVNGLPEHYKLYFEETEFCVKLQKSGWELWLDTHSIAYHPSQSKKDGVPARHFAYYFIRNNLAFWKENFGIPIVLQFPRTVFVMIKEVILPLRRAQSFSLAYDRAKYALAGLLDGVLFALKKPTYFENRLFPPKN